MTGGLVATEWSHRRKRIGVRKKRAGIYLTVPDDIEQCDNVWSSRQVLEDLDLSLDLLLLDWLENLDDTLLIVGDVDALEHLGVFSATCTSS